MKNSVEHLKQEYKHLYDMIDMNAQVYVLSPTDGNIEKLKVKDCENFVLVGGKKKTTRYKHGNYLI